MKKLTSLLAVTAISLISFAQKQSVTWGEELKMKKGSTNLTVIHTDKSGVYLQEEHKSLKSYYVVGGSFRESASLVKLDKNLTELYRTDFNKELIGKDFVQFFAINDKLLIIASEYQKSERTMNIYGAEVDKSNGEIKETWKLIASFVKDEKKDNIYYKLIPNADTSRIVVINTVSGKEKNTYQVQEFDKNLKATARPAIISNEFEDKTYKLEDLLYTSQKIILVGRTYGFQEGKKKKEKFLEFLCYNIRIYDKTGKQESEINTNINGKWLNSTKLMVSKDRELILASFYSNEKKGKTTDGLLVQRIDPNTGKVLNTAEKNINNSLLTTEQGETDEDKDEDIDSESKEERKEREKVAKLKDEGEGFSKYIKFRQIYFTPDNGLVLLAENFKYYSYTTHSSTMGTSGIRYGSGYNYTTHVYHCGDIMMVKLDASDNISWLQVLPKYQLELVRLPEGTGSYFDLYDNFWDPAARPFYAGFGSIQTPSGIQIYFNDIRKNNDVIQPGKKIYRLDNFSKSDCFVLTLDQITGKFQRKTFFSNWDQPVAMPRLGVVMGNEMYLVGRTDRSLAKTKVLVGKITVK